MIRLRISDMALFNAQLAYMRQLRRVEIAKIY